MISISVKTSSELKRLKKALKKEELNKIEKACASAAKELAEATPVDTGYAKSRWRVIKRQDPLLPFAIENDTPYIDFLNAGNSKQAPKYFVEKIMLTYGRPVGLVVEYKE